jgi:hypothetical protein
LLTEAAYKPVLCVVDDAQWLDHASLRAVAFVARLVQAERIAIICCAREPADLLGGLLRMALSGLTERDAMTLITLAAPEIAVPLARRVLAVAQGRGTSPGSPRECSGAPKRASEAGGRAS